MKIIIVLLVAAVHLLCSPCVVAQDKQIITRQRNLTQRINVNPGNTFMLYSSIGDVHFKTWDKNEVAVDAVVTGLSYDEARSQLLADNVYFEEVKKGDSIKLWTRLKAISDIGLVGNTKKSELNISYTLHIPKDLKLGILCASGEVYFDDDDYIGELKAEVSVGAFHAGSLTGAYKSIMVFPYRGTSSVQFIDKGEIFGPSSSIGRGGLVVDSANELHVDGFDSVRIGSVNSLIIGKRHGSVRIGSAVEVIGKMWGANVVIDTVLSIVSMKLDSCKVTLGYTGRQLRMVDVEAKKSVVHFRPNTSSDIFLSVKFKGSKVSKPEVPDFVNIWSVQTWPGMTQYSARIGNGRGYVSFDLDKCKLYLK